MRSSDSTRGIPHPCTWLVLVAVVAILPACVYQRYTTESPRSATEQLLLSGAIEKAVMELEWPGISGRAVAVETVALNQNDAAYLQASAEARARSLGARVVARDDAEMILVVLAGSLGTVSRQASFGVPSLPTPMGVMSPELPLARVLKQRGYAKLRLVGYNQAGERTAESPPVMERSSFELYSLIFLVVRRNDVYPGESMTFGID